ncbi:MAG: hypothetical protein PHX70_02280 [Clostridium sp.]|nr:hypothetical protein [Clostridium sp.]
MKTVKELVSFFNDKTEEMFKCFDNSDYVELNNLLLERQKIIDIFEKNSDLYEKDTIANEFRNIDIMPKNEKLDKLIKENMQKIKEKLKGMNKDGAVKNSYGRNISGLSFFISKKIY